MTWDAHEGRNYSADPALGPTLRTFRPGMIFTGQRWIPAASPADSRRRQTVAPARDQVQPLLVVFEDLHWIDAALAVPTARLLHGEARGRRRPAVA
jgi:hypothetical protein